jgi:hypothetical protein
MHGSMFVPIILRSDKTTVSVATGHTQYYPLYLSIGNIHNNVRRAHHGGVNLIAFLATAKSKLCLCLKFCGLFDFDYSQQAA